MRPSLEILVLIGVSIVEFVNATVDSNGSLSAPPKYENTVAGLNAHPQYANTVEGLNAYMLQKLNPIQIANDDVRRAELEALFLKVKDLIESMAPDALITKHFTHATYNETNHVHIPRLLQAVKDQLGEGNALFPVIATAGHIFNGEYATARLMLLHKCQHNGQRKKE